jgi:hypothetical protein
MYELTKTQLCYMQKNTISTLNPNTGAAESAPLSVPKKGDKNLAEPSKRTIENILNYSKALHVEPKADGEDFVEYVAN